MNKIKVIIDTDIGSDIDDAYALTFAQNCPELDIKLIITNSNDSYRKARIAHAFAPRIKILEGISIGKSTFTTNIDSEYLPDKLEDSLDLFSESEDVYYISIGALSNLAYLLSKNISFKQIIIMGGSINCNYNGEPNPVAEWNIKNDILASRKVFNSNQKILLVPLDSTYNLILDKQSLNKIRDCKNNNCSLLDKHLLEMQSFLEKKWNIKEKLPVLHDPLAVAQAFKSFGKIESIPLIVEDDGKTKRDTSGNKIDVLINSDKSFIDFFLERILNN